MTDALEAHLNHQLQHGRDFFWHRLRWRLVSEFIGSAESVVDVGAGTGLLGEHLRRTAPSVAYRFVEPIPALEEHLERRFGADANARGLATYGGRDVVTLLDVVEHQEDDVGFVREIVDRMTRGTTLLVTVPALSSLWSDWDVSLGHFRRYEKETLARCFDERVDIRELSYLFPELLPLGVIRRRSSGRRAAHGETRAETEFPELPRVVNDALYALGTVPLALRRRVPRGTSLFAAVRRR